MMSQAPLARQRIRFKLEDFNYDHAREHLKTNLKNYKLVGELPEKAEPRPVEMTPKICFLFTKGDQFYTCSAKDLLDKNKAPQLSIADGGYLHVKLKTRNGFILRVREGSDLSGHEFLTMGFKELVAETAGEMYFDQGTIILSNHKSEGFKFSPQGVKRKMDLLLGTAESTFVDELDAKKVAQIVESRRKKNISKLPLSTSTEEILQKLQPHSKVTTTIEKPKLRFPTLHFTPVQPPAPKVPAKRESFFLPKINLNFEKVTGSRSSQTINGRSELKFRFI